MAPQEREAGKDTIVEDEDEDEDELRPGCGGCQLWTRKGQQAQECGQLGEAGEHPML